MPDERRRSAPKQRQPRGQALEGNAAAVLQMLARGASTRVVADAFRCRKASVVAFKRRHAVELDSLRQAVADETRRQTLDDAVPDKAERLRIATGLLRTTQEFVDEHQGLTTEIVRSGAEAGGRTLVKRRFQTGPVDATVKLLRYIGDEIGDGSIAPQWTEIHMTVAREPRRISDEERRRRIIPSD